MTESVQTEQRQLIEDYLRGETEAVGRVNGWIEVVLHRRYRSLSHEWEDLRQEVNLRVFNNLKRGNFDGRSSLRTYVHQIAENVCADVVRRANRRHRHDDQLARTEAGPASSLPVEAAGCIARELLAKILDGLSDDDVRLVALVFVERLPYGEVARRLGVPVGTVKSRMSRCKERLLRRRADLTRLGKEP